MEDYAKRNTKEKFNWREAVITVLIVPGVLGYVLLLKLALGAIK